MLRSKLFRGTAFALTLGFCATSVQAAALRLQILHTSDLEGGVEAIADAPNFAAVVEALERDAADEGVASIVLSAGDNFIPGPFFSAAGDGSVRAVLRAVLVNPSAREGVGRVDLAIMNAIGFDASALGNHEFDSGSGVLAEIIGTDIRDANRDGILDEPRWLGADFPFLSSNLDFSADTALSRLFSPVLLESTQFASPLLDLDVAAARPKIATATLIERDGELIGVIGATTPLLASISSPGDTQVREPGAGSNDMAALASLIQPEIDRVLAAGADKIVLVTHLQQIGLEEQLVPLLRGVDVSIAGGSDTLLADADDRLRSGDTAQRAYPIVSNNADGDPVVIVSTKGQYSYVGRLVIDFDAAGRVIPDSIDSLESGAFATDDLGVTTLWGNEDAFAPGRKAHTVRTLTEAVRDIVIAKDGNVFGRAQVFLEGRRTAVRTEETNMGNLTADANLHAARKIDPSVMVSHKNGGGIRAEIGSIDGLTGALLPTAANPESGKQAGEISQLDIENSLRFNNGLTLVTLTPAQLRLVLEHAVAESGPGATPGRFAQLGGLAFSFDPALPAGDRVRTIAIKNAAGETLDLVLADGSVIGDPTRAIRMVTLNFLAGGGDGYPFPGFQALDPAFFDRVDLVDGSAGASGFAPTGSEQDALAVYLRERFAEQPFTRADTPATQDARIQNLSLRSDTVAVPMTPPAGAIVLSVLGTYATGLFDESAQEIAAYDPINKQLFVTNAADASVDILSIANPEVPVQVRRINAQELFGSARIQASPNSVTVHGRLVAVAIARTWLGDGDAVDRPMRGLVAFFDLAGELLDTVRVGYLPDMLTFTPDGERVVVANEGEPASDYSFDPEGSISVIRVQPVRDCGHDARRPAGKRHAAHDNAPRGPFGKGPGKGGAFAGDDDDDDRDDAGRHRGRCGFEVGPGDVKTADFRRFNRSADALRRAGVRIYGPGASVAQDLEPEYVAISADSKTAYVSLQENNAIAVVHIPSARVERIVPLGLKDWSATDGLDASNRDGTINITPWPVFGMYQPDALALFNRGRETYLVTANEGDARDYDGFTEEARLADVTLDPTVFPDAAALQDDAALGRLQISTASGDLDGDGAFEEIHAYGARSFSIWRVARHGGLELVFDSGSLFEQITASLIGADFNSNNDENGSFDSRSDDKGPEPEGVAVGTVGGRTYAFVGLERVGGIMVFDVSTPAAPLFVQYINNRDFVADAESPEAGDLGPEGVLFIDAADSPIGVPLLVVANEVSGTTTIYRMD